MKFLIQKIDNKIVHDFSFTLLESMRYQNWLHNEKVIDVKYINTWKDDGVWFFKPFHKNYVPVGSVEFVTSWFQRFHNHTPNPINVPLDLFNPIFTQRKIFNGNHMDFEDLMGSYFIKSNDKIKGFCEIIKFDKKEISIPAGVYQISELVTIYSEWRAFVYKRKLVGLHNYSGDFIKFPDVNQIEAMIDAYSSSPIAYTLDVGVNRWGTFVIEVHDFFSCGLYGFANHKLLPYMHQRWHNEYIKKLMQ